MVRKAWQNAFVLNNQRAPDSVDYVYRFVTMGLASGYSGEDVLQPVAIAIDAGVLPSGPGLWSQPVDRTGVEEERAEWRRLKSLGASYLNLTNPEIQDELRYGANYAKYRWGKLRIIMGADGSIGRLVRLLGGGRDNATTFSANLIVFTKPLDLSLAVDMHWLIHELRHVMQAQELGTAYLPKYMALSVLGHANNPMEQDSNAFANAAGTGAPPRWD